jgi:hypothetical protein
MRTTHGSREREGGRRQDRARTRYRSERIHGPHARDRMKGALTAQCGQTDRERRTLPAYLAVLVVQIHGHVPGRSQAIRG